MTSHITYELPLSERIRTFLRIEFLFQQAHAYFAGDGAWASRATLLSLLEILALLSRADIKTEVLKELERQSSILERLEDVPGVDRERLVKLLDEMDLLIDRMHNAKGQMGQELRTNEFLNAIKQRSTIPGGTCEFDLPAYHFWLQQPPEVRKEHLQRWLAHFDLLAQGVNMMLRIVRGITVPTREIAEAGFFQRSLDAGVHCHIIRVGVPVGQPYFAEISGGRHRFTVRFLEHRLEDRPVQVMTDVPFELTCCVL